MGLNAKYGNVTLDDGNMEYIRFGAGKRSLVMLPGLGDSLRTLKGTQFPMALMYRMFAKDFTVYVFSRRAPLPQGYTTRMMARDQAEAMDRLGIATADIFGVSMGGMIAQHLAIDFPEKVGKLVLAVAASKPNPILSESIEEWVNLAKAGDHTAFMESNLRRIYSEKYYRNNKWMLPLLGKLTKPKSYERLFVQAEACLSHNACEELQHIKAPAFVIGGEKDNTLGGEPSRELADRIPGAKLLLYENWGHGLYEEAKDFNGKVLEFLKE